MTGEGQLTVFTERQVHLNFLYCSSTLNCASELASYIIIFCISTFVSWCVNGYLYVFVLASKCIESSDIVDKLFNQK